MAIREVLTKDSPASNADSGTFASTTLTPTLELWVVHAEHRKLIDELKKSVVSLVKKAPPGYEFQFTTAEWGIPTPHLPNERLFVVGPSLDRPLGYALCLVNKAHQDVGQISELYKLKNPLKSPVDDMQKRVLPSTLHRYPGYSEYTGKGELVFVSYIEAFQRSQGIGRALLEFIKGTNPELIELEAIEKPEECYFERQGFRQTGIIADRTMHAGRRVLVWNNPAFSRTEID